ncbi:MAG TPA: hypothetical protein DEB06_06220 [Phycisphaerales bacterium]|nr:hypothetical protein [Phycisphaerales bacterium]
MNRSVIVCVMGTALALQGCIIVNDAGPRDERPSGEARRVDDVLNDLHDAAARAQEERYFNLFAPDGVFIGTAEEERWTVPVFRDYAHARFSTGQGWTYTPSERHVFVSRDGETAWFDEMLDNAKYGRCRGTGVLVRIDDDWKIAQYHLTVPIPNDLLPGFADQIRAHHAGN